MPIARYLTLLCCTVVAAMPSPAAAQTSPVEHHRLRDSAESALAAGAFDRAAELFRRLADQAPGNSELWDRLVVANFRRQRWDDAREALERAVALGDTRGARGPFTVGLIHASLGRDSAALPWIRRALAEGYEDRPRLRTDSAFRRLWQDPAFRELAGIPPAGLSRTAGWRFDLDYLVEEVGRMHAAPSRPGDSPAFRAAVARLREQVPHLSDEAALIELMRLVALLGDGHSAIYGPGPDSPLQLTAGSVPLKLYQFADGWYVVDADPRHADLLGARVERLGPLTPDAALDSLRALRGVDNPMTLRWLGPQFYLPSLLMLRAIGAARGDSLALEVVQDGARRTVSVPATDWTARRKLRPQTAPDTARWLRHVDRNYWMETLAADVVYVQFNQVRDQDDGPGIGAFAAVLTDSLRASGAHHLIVDLRHNNGGNNFLVRPLVRALVAWEQAAPAHAIWVLTGRNTFSAAQNFLNRVERWTDARIVGEPSSSRPNFVGEETNLELPWSRVRGSVSTRYWQDSDPTDARQWIYPDVPVSLTAADYFGGRDPVLKTVLEIIGAGPSH